MKTRLAKLCDELNAYCTANGLPQHSADELVFNENVTAVQRQWLADFCARWKDEAGLDSLLTYLDQNYVKLVDSDEIVALSPDRETLYWCPQLIDGTPEKSDICAGHLNWGEVTAPEDQKFLDAVNRIFGTSFRYEDFAGR